VAEVLVAHAPVVPAASVAHLLPEVPQTDAAASAHALLRLLLSERTGLPPAGHVLVRRCTTCGEAHGKPRLQHPSLHVSLAHVPGAVAVAITDAGPVGVDLERVEATGFDGFDDVVLAPGETASTPAERARLWTRKEAVLKATGDGLTRDPRTVDVRGSTALGAHLLDVDLPGALAGAVAVLCRRRPRLVVEERSLIA
jgi:4'-phosphopantetheinyl transferase